MNNPYQRKALRAITNIRRCHGLHLARNCRRMCYWIDQAVKYSLKADRLTRQQRERAGLPKAYTVALP